MDVDILDQEGRVVCRGEVDQDGGVWSGELRWLTQDMLALFSDYESYVNDQIIPLAEECALIIEKEHYRAYFPAGGEVVPILNLQVLPLGRELFFRRKP